MLLVLIVLAAAIAVGVAFVALRSFEVSSRAFLAIWLALATFRVGSFVIGSWLLQVESAWLQLLAYLMILLTLPELALIARYTGMQEIPLDVLAPTVFAGTLAWLAFTLMIARAVARRSSSPSASV